MTKVLFVCLGNICRSPLAEALFKHKIKQLQWADQFIADSCGTGDYHIGSQPDKRTIASAEKHGVEIFHVCRQLTRFDLEEFHYILAMDKNIHQDILLMANSSSFDEKIFMMRDFDPLFPGADVPDPYHGGNREFQEVFGILNRSVDGFIEHLKKAHSS